MRTCLAIAVVLAAAVSPLYAGGISGQYVEARTCDVWTAPCFANSDMNITGKHAVIGWKIDKGQEGSAQLDGLSVVAILEATDTLGQEQTGSGKAVVLVDKKANAAQRDALVALAKKLGGDLVRNVVAVEATPIEMTVNHCKEGGCAFLDAGVAKVTTRCIDIHHDKMCGNEKPFYAPLAKGVKADAAFVTQNDFSGKGFDKTWTDSGRRGAYVGSFAIGQ